MTAPPPLAHGGNLADAEARFGRPTDGWLDLSTGINPNAYPVSGIDEDNWHRLPESGETLALAEIARQFFGAPPDAAVVPTPGTQAALQILPLLRGPSRVAVIGPTYAEHARCWRLAGHDVREVDEVSIPDDADVVVIVNPNNPDGRVVKPDDLARRAASLGKRGGWLIIDEAFADGVPEISVAPHCPMPGLLVLRSFGKFFGLAGIRLGFVLCAPTLGHMLATRLGPWSVSGPAIGIGRQAYADQAWTDGTRAAIAENQRAMDTVLTRHGLSIIGGTGLFRLIRHAPAAPLQVALATSGIWTRVFDERPDWMRLGVPGNADDLIRLDGGLGAALRLLDTG